MRHFNKYLAAIFLIFFLYLPDSKSNNVVISNLALVDQNTALDFSMIRFDISWENSWRTSTLESNWDAVWLFAKYRRKWDTDWYHCFLNNSGHVPPMGSVISPGLVNTGAAFSAITNPAAGVFLYRSSDGIGNVSFSEVKLQWNYGANGLADYDSVEICLFAIEMVYIPEASFYVGDNDVFNTSASSGRFRRGDTDLPFQITSEGTLSINNTSTSELWGTSTTGTNTIGTVGSLPASYPKGYGAFYVMKHELSQVMYKEYLNKLTRTQQAGRVSVTTVNNFMGTTSAHTTPQNRNGIRLMSDPGTPLRRVYGNDLNNNGVEGETDDGMYVACNFISADDLRAFADWAGLRPITELEFEKAARGTLAVVPNERAWGNTVQVEAVGIVNPRQHNELASNATANVSANNLISGPLRCGIFAKAATNRQEAGAGYYGVLELSGNLWEYTVSVGLASNRSFNGQMHGNGTLTAAGASDVTGWPSDLGIRGAAYTATTFTTLQTSDRAFASNSYTATRFSTTGIRLGRSAP